MASIVTSRNIRTACITPTRILDHLRSYHHSNYAISPEAPSSSLYSTRVLSSTSLISDTSNYKKWTLFSSVSPCYFSSSATKSSSKVRRRRGKQFEKYKVEGMVPLFKKRDPVTSVKGAYQQFGIDEPYSYDGSKPDEDYLKLASLSPWVPIPDPVARKMFDMAQATSEDIHVDLGSGDGRVNFHAIDGFNVKKSIGIDVDEGIVKVAKQRMMKRHPQPNIEFYVADLLDMKNNIWEVIVQENEITIITMFFVSDALQQLKPILERTLIGKKCKIITCGYEMKGWNASIIETILGTTVYLYEWGGNASVQQDGTNEEEESFFVSDDDILVEKPDARKKGMSNYVDDDASSPSLIDKFQNKDKDVKHVEEILPGYDPNSRVDGYYDFDSDDENEKDEDKNEADQKKKDGSNKNRENVSSALDSVVEKYTNRKKGGCKKRGE